MKHLTKEQHVTGLLYYAIGYLGMSEAAGLAGGKCAALAAALEEAEENDLPTTQLAGLIQKHQEIGTAPSGGS